MGSTSSRDNSTNKFKQARWTIRAAGLLILLSQPISVFPLTAVMASSSLSSSSLPRQKPIVYTIAGSDSGGGAGIQADLLTMASFGCHGCSAVTCLTAQNSVQVTAVHTPPTSFLHAQLTALVADLPPFAIKIGMLGTKDVVVTVGAFLKSLRETTSDSNHRHEKVWVVLDPVMVSTSGSRLMDQEAQQALLDYVFPYVDVITPNKFEAEALLQQLVDGGSGGNNINKRTLDTASDVEQAARDLLQYCQVPAVWIKGGHSNAECAYARDYFLSSAAPESTTAATALQQRERRLCNGEYGVWLQSRRYDTIHTHGTGCTLSSAMAAALAMGEASRRRRRRCNNGGNDGGAVTAMDLVDACCLAKAYVTAGIDQGRQQLGQGPGPVAHTVFPNSHLYYPSIPLKNQGSAFVPLQAYTEKSLTTTTITSVDDNRPTLGRILPIVDSVEWVQRLCDVSSSAAKSNRKNGALCTKIRDIQLRIKGEKSKDRIFAMVQECQDLCAAANIRLWINDYWEAAVAAHCFGVHVGQEDLVRCMDAGGLHILRKHHMALGISTHSYGELAVALGVQPSYISLGPVFATSSKNVQFDPQGLGILSKWRQLIPPDVPLVAIGGIGDAGTAARVRAAGADCVALIGAVTGSSKADDIATTVSELNDAMIGSSRREVDYARSIF